MSKGPPGPGAISHCHAAAHKKRPTNRKTSGRSCLLVRITIFDDQYHNSSISCICCIFYLDQYCLHYLLTPASPAWYKLRQHRGMHVQRRGGFGDPSEGR
jgi:hypothetical protein